MKFHRLLILSVLVMLGIAQGQANAADPRDPPTIIRETTDEILDLLEEQRAEFEAQPEKLRDVVRERLLPLMDLDYSARLILGRAGRGLSEQQIDEFAETMCLVLIDRYSDGLLEFRSDEQVEILPLRGGNNDKLTRVRTRIKLDNGQSTPIDYAFRKTDEGWKTFDVTVEGVSYVLTFRNQIAPQVEAKGIEKVTADLRAGDIELDD
ncbi:MAG: ABC transporter substrate-binding protein [Xanthomonadales bacterium]|nr:ABC transporter substrate-binding protein [Xanthomonadales bacterium]